MNYFDKIIELINIFENDLSKMTFVESYDKMAEQVLSLGLVSMQIMAVNRQKLSADDQDTIDSIFKVFEEMDKIYLKLKKGKRIPDDKPNQRFGEGILEQIKKIKSSIPTIEQTIPR